MGRSPHTCGISIKKLIIEHPFSNNYPLLVL